MKKVFLLFFAACSLLFSADTTMEIRKQVERQPVVAIEDASAFIGDWLNKKFHKILVGDLKVSCNFSPSEEYYTAGFADSVNYAIHKNANLVLRYQLVYDSKGSLGVNVKLFDLLKGELAYEKSYKTDQKARYVFLAHKIAIDLSNYMQAPSIDWMEGYVILSRYVSPKESEIVVADYTLTYQKTVIKGGLNLFPKWATSSQDSFYYTAYEDLPTLYKVDLYTGQRQKLLSSPGMLVCSDVSKDGTRLLLTMAPSSQPDIYLFDTKSRLKQRLTDYSGIDVNANFIDGESRIVFVSDRLGYPNIFAMRLGSRGVEQLVYHGKNNSACTAFEDMIVFSSRETDNEFSPNTFNLYMISTGSDAVKRLTAGGINQFPKFSSDGQSVLFIKQFNGQSYLGIVRLAYSKSFTFPLSVGKIQSIDW